MNITQATSPAFIQDLLMRNGLVRDALTALNISVMKKGKKEEYYGTSVKRYYSMTGSNSKENFGAEGFIYINYADIVDFDMLLKVVAHEVAHLLDDKDGVEQEILGYLKKEYEGEIK